MKQKIFNKINAFNYDESGVTSIEYAIIITLLSFVLVIALPPIGSGFAGTIDVVDVAIGGQSSAQYSGASGASGASSQTTKTLGNCSKSGGSGSASKYGGWGR